MEFCWASIAAAASSLAADSRASSGPSMSATSCAVEARPPAGAAAAPAAAASASALGSGGLKNTGNGDPPVGVPLISTVSYAPRPRHSAQSVSSVSTSRQQCHAARHVYKQADMCMHANMHSLSCRLQRLTAASAMEVHLVVATGTDSVDAGVTAVVVVLDQHHWVLVLWRPQLGHNQRLHRLNANCS
jgi:hypothetical protein